MPDIIILILAGVFFGVGFAKFIEFLFFKKQLVIVFFLFFISFLLVSWFAVAYTLNNSPQKEYYLKIKNYSCSDGGKYQGFKIPNSQNKINLTKNTGTYYNKSKKIIYLKIYDKKKFGIKFFLFPNYCYRIINKNGL